MFRKMRRHRQELSVEESISILNNTNSGVLAVLGDNDYPYAVPLNHLYENNTLYFHCATSGHKMDAIKSHNKAYFCVIAQDEVVAEKYTTKYKSVIAFGKIHICEDEREKLAILKSFAHKFSPNQTEEQNMAEITAHISHTEIITLAIENISGKIGQELLNSL